MPEAAANLEPRNNSEYQQAAIKIARELLSSQSYAKLSEADLRSAGLIANEESVTDYFAREMRFWNEEPDYKSENASTIYNLFRNIELITIDEWLEFGKKKSEPVIQMMQALNACGSSVEYANKFRELGIAHYPTTEIIVNPGKRVNYVVDSTMQPPRSITNVN